MTGKPTIALEENAEPGSERIRNAYVFPFAGRRRRRWLKYDGNVCAIDVDPFRSKRIEIARKSRASRYFATNYDRNVCNFGKLFSVFQLLDSGAQPSLDMERPYADPAVAEYSRPRAREYSIPEKSIMELFSPTAPHRQRPRS